MLRLFLWLGMALGFAVLMLLRWPLGDYLQTDLYALLPDKADSLWEQKAYRIASTAYESQLLLLVDGDDPEAVQVFLDDAINRLGQQGLIVSVNDNDPAVQWQQLLGQLQARRWNLLSDVQYQQLEHDLSQYLSRFRSLLYSPLGAGAANMLQEDPAGLWREYAVDLLALQGSIINRSDSNAVTALVKAAVPANRFSSKNGLYQAWRDLKISARQQQLSFYATGAPLYAAVAANSAKQEMTSVGVVSLVLLMVLLWLFLRSWSAITLVLLCLSTGLIGGLVATLWLIGQVHVLTLVFGSTLIGVAADYAFHYLSHRRDQHSPAALRTILPGLTLSVFSSGLAFLLLALLPFPGMSQIGVFMSAGLLSSYLTVVLLFPACYRPPKKQVALPGLFVSIRFLRVSPWLMVLVAIPVVVLLAVGVSPADEDIRSYYQASPELESDQRFIMQHLGAGVDSRFILLKAENEQMLASSEQRLLQALAPLRLASSSYIVPDEQRQRRNFLQWKALYQSPVFERHLVELGFDGDQRQQLINSVPNQFKLLRVADIEVWPAGMGTRLGCDAQMCASWIPLKNGQNLGTVSAVVDRFSQAQLVDPVATFNRLLSEYRRMAMVLLGIAAVLVAVVLWVLRGWKMALQIIWLPMLASGGCLVLAGVWQGGLLLSNALAALVVAGVSLDFAIFRRLSSPSEQPNTLLAITLSAVTSVLAFGVLSLSQTPLISSFGMTIALGLALAYTLVWIDGEVIND